MIRLRLLASFVLLLATALTLGWLRYEGSHSRGLLAQFPLPPRIDRWVAAQDKEFDEQVLSEIDADSYAMRFYQAGGDTGVWVYVGMYGGRSGYARGAHDPEVCFPAQGWEVLNSSSAVVPREGDQIHSKLLRVQRINEEQTVLYWFQPAGRWPSGGVVEQVLQMLDAAWGRPQYAFVRISGVRDGSGRSEADVIEFASAIAPSIRSEVERF